MKDVLFNKFNSFKGGVLILLLSAGFSLNVLAQTKQVTGKVTSAEDGSARHVFPSPAPRDNFTNEDHLSRVRKLDLSTLSAM